MNDSKIIKVKKGTKYSICSCGKSKSLPYCDNEHREFNAKNNCSYKSVKVYLSDDNSLKIMCSNWGEDS